MKKPMFVLAILAILFSSWWATSTNAVIQTGGGWVTDVVSRSRVDRVCRDGFEWTYVPTVNSPLEVPPRLSVSFGSEVLPTWFNEVGTISDSLKFDDLFTPYYYPQLGAPFSVYSVQIDGSHPELPGITSPHYFEEVSFFPSLLNVDDHVAFIENLTARIIDVQPVEDCFVRTLTVTDEQVVNSDDFLALPYDFLEPEKLIVEVVSTPAIGDMQLDGVSLAETMQFDLNNIYAGELVYIADGMTAEDDRFTYHVRGTYRVSLSEDDQQSTTGESADPSISADGSRVAFTSDASDIVEIPYDLNGASDVYLRIDNNNTEVVSHANQLFTGNNRSYNPEISADGSTVTFVSAASDLAESCDPLNDNGGVRDVFSWTSSSIELISVFNFDECEGISERSLSPSIADAGNWSDGRIVFQTLSDIPAYTDVENGVSDLLLFDDSETRLVYGLMTIYPVPPLFGIRAPDDRSYAADISADGQVIAFTSLATDLFVGDNNGFADVGLRDLNTELLGGAVRVSITSNGAEAVGGDSEHPSISQYGTHIAFESLATNLSPLGNNSMRQIYVHDRDTGCTLLLSRGYDGLLGDGDSTAASISANGQFIAFQSTATNLVEDDMNGVSDIFVIDRDPDRDDSYYSDPSNCEPGPSRLFRVSIAGNGTEGNGASTAPAISDNGDFIAFASEANNLVEGDTNGLQDVFVHYLGYTGEIRFFVPDPTQHHELAYRMFLPIMLR